MPVNVWFVEPEAKTVELLQLDGAPYRIVDLFAGEVTVRLVPFDAIVLELSVFRAR